MRIKVLIADDEPAARENILLRLQSYPDFSVIAQADNGSDVIVLAKNSKPDVIFLDYNMPGLNGIEAASILSKMCNAAIVFISAYDQFAIQAFRYEALDYLLKPIVDSHFEQMIQRIKVHHETLSILKRVKEVNPTPPYLKRLGIKDGHSVNMVNVSTIESIETAGDYLAIHTNEQTHIHKQTLKSLVPLLDPSIFLQTHRTCLVNLNFVKAVEITSNSHKVTLLNDKVFPISRRFLKHAKALLKEKIMARQTK